MATTTYGTTGNTTRTNSALWWGIGILAVIALIAFFLMRGGPTDTAPATTSDVPAATDTNATMGTTTDTGVGTGSTGTTTDTNAGAAGSDPSAGSNTNTNMNPPTTTEGGASGTTNANQ